MRVLTRKEFQDDVAKMWSEAVEAEYKDLIEKAVLAEREACAKVCDELHWTWHMGDNSGPKECATAIRARGEA